MHVAILGGTGRLGGSVARALLRRGHQAACVGRSASSGTVPEGAEPVAADVLDPEALARAVRGAEAVVVALSIPRRSRSPFAPILGPRDLHSRSMASLLEVGPPGRVLKVSAQGVGDSAPRAGWGFRALVAASNLRPAFEDHAVADRLLAESALRWTIVRPPVLAEGRRGPLVASEHGVTRSWTRVGIDDVADWMVEALEDEASVGRVLTLRPA